MNGCFCVTVDINTTKSPHRDTSEAVLRKRSVWAELRENERNTSSDGLWAGGGGEAGREEPLCPVVDPAGDGGSEQMDPGGRIGQGDGNAVAVDLNWHMYLEKVGRDFKLFY